jgi:hypothetical protein
VWRRQRIGHLAGLSLAAVVLISAIATANAAGPSGPSRLTDTVRVWHVGAATVVAVDGRAPRLLDVLRKAKINRVDALIATSNAADLESAGRLYQPVLMLTADTPPGSYRAGKVRIDVEAFGDTIDVEVSAIGRADSG